MPNQPLKHNLPDDIIKSLEDVLGETAITHWAWWEIAFNIRAETQKLLDKQDGISDPIHAELCQVLIQHGMEMYNQIISTFMTAGLRAEGMKFRQRHQRSIQIIRNALDDPKKND